MTTTTASPSSSPGAAFSHVLSAAVDFAARKANQATEGWTEKLNDIASGGGPESDDGSGGGLVDDVLEEGAEGQDAKTQAGLKGARAALQGKNPVWAAIKGAWAGGSVGVKAAIVTAIVSLVLLAALSPVLLLVFLLSLLIVAAVTKLRSSQS
jgi:hypothetical protein